MNVTKNKVPGTQVIERLFQIIYCFSAQQKTLSLAEIAKITKLHPATTHRILQALVSQGIINQDPSTNRYRLGYKLVKLGDIAKQSNDIYQVAQPFLQELRSLWGEAIVIDVPNSNMHMVTILLIPSTFRLGTTQAYDDPTWPHATASGKAYLAFIPESELNIFLKKELPRYTPNTIIEKDKLIAELKLTKSRGYATNFEEQEPGLVAVAAPIFNEKDQVFATLSIGGPAHRMNETRLQEVATTLVNTANQISKEMGR